MLNSIVLINKILKKKEADLVAVSRRFIKEPDWLKKNKKLEIQKNFTKNP